MSEHIVPRKTYYIVWALLMALMIITAALSRVPLGEWNTVIALAIATVKALLVLLFFMHLKYDSRFNALMFLSSLLFIGVFFAYTLNDTDRRGQVDGAQGVERYSGSGKMAPGGEEPMGHEDDEKMPMHRAAGGSETK